MIIRLFIIVELTVKTDAEGIEAITTDRYKKRTKRSTLGSVS